jgi:hypothetical protein
MNAIQSITACMKTSLAAIRARVRPVTGCGGTRRRRGYGTRTAVPTAAALHPWDGATPPVVWMRWPERSDATRGIPTAISSRRIAPTRCGRHGPSMGAHGPSRTPTTSRNVPSDSRALGTEHACFGSVIIEALATELPPRSTGRSDGVDRTAAVTAGRAVHPP